MKKIMKMIMKMKVMRSKDDNDDNIGYDDRLCETYLFQSHDDAK